MHIDLSGKLAIVTASTKGIGLGSARGLAESGARVVINGRTQDAVDKTVAAIKADLPDARLSGFAADLGTREGCDALIAAFPSCDILVNNLGIYGEQDFFDTPDEVWETFFQVNILSGVRLSRAYLPAMRKKNWGRVVFISSESAFNIPDEMIHYGFTKAGVTAIARGLAKRMAGTGVTVNSVLPGPTLTEGMAHTLEAETAKTGHSLEDAAAAYVRKMRPASILQRAATVEEVANMVVYACSREASATTGASLRVEGGVINTL